jgi:hypothetical protein
MYACAGVGILYLVLLLQLIGDVEPVCWVRVRTLRLLDMAGHSQLPRTHSILSYLEHSQLSRMKSILYSLQIPLLVMNFVEIKPVFKFFQKRNSEYQT